MMLRTPNGTRPAAAALSLAGAAIVVAAATLVLPGPAYANVRYRAESPSDTTSPKSVTASCPPGDVLMGTGARVKGGGGGVWLEAVVPARTSVEVRAEALPGYPGEWSVVAVAFCVSATWTTPTVVASPAGSPTATCPAGTVVSGTGFDLPAGVPLTGLIPDEEGASVTVRTPFVLIGGAPRVGYAVCVPGSPASEGGGPYYTRFEATSPLDRSPRKVVTVERDGDWQFPSMSGAGAVITVLPDPTDPSPVVSSDAVIDVLMPSDDGRRVTVEAARRWRAADPGRGSAARRPGDRSGDSPAAPFDGDDDDIWSVTGYGVDHDIY